MRTRRHRKNMLLQQLVRAVDACDVKGVHALLRSGVDVNAITKKTTPFMHCLKKIGTDIEQNDRMLHIFKAMLAAGGRIREPLLYPVLDGEKKVKPECLLRFVRCVLEAGEDPNKRYHEDTAMHRIAHYSSWKFRQLVSLLKEYGGDINAPDEDNENLFFLRCSHIYKHTDFMLYSDLEFLLDVGADPNVISTSQVNAGMTPLTCLCESENWDGVNLLLNSFVLSSSTLNAAMEWDGWTALMFAIYSNRTDVVRRLLDAGATEAINQVVIKADDSRITPLMQAIYNGNREVFYMLLGVEGIDLSVGDQDGRNAYMIACDLGHWDLAYALVYAGGHGEVWDKLKVKLCEEDEEEDEEDEENGSSSTKDICYPEYLQYVDIMVTAGVPIPWSYKDVEAMRPSAIKTYVRLRWNMYAKTIQRSVVKALYHPDHPMGESWRQGAKRRWEEFCSSS